MADEGTRGYGTVIPVKVGWLADYPANAATTDDTLDSLKLIFFDEALDKRLIDRPIELVKREVIGLPNGDFKLVQRAFDELVAEGCLVIFGPPYVSDNVVPLSAHVERTADVPIITLAGSETALGGMVLRLEQWVHGRRTGDVGGGAQDRRTQAHRDRA